jgi:membrane dipeptidase
VSALALDLFRQSQVIDLHIDSFIWHRVFGYDLNRRHGRGLLGGLVYSQADIPRVRETGINGATWVITTNPARDARDRQEALRENLAELVGILDASGSVQVCRTVSDYWEAQRRGRHAATIGIQGGNALERGLGATHELAKGLILRVTLVHLTSSSIGCTSSPARVGKDGGLSSFGRQFVQELDALQIFVDLAHISRQGFWDAVEAHDHTKPLLVSHTGVCGVFDHWRNLDDDQLRAVGDSGGVVGIMYHSEFLGDPLFSGKAESIVRHMEHVTKCAGADCVALGSDWDGAICPPTDMRTCSELPVLVEIMLRRGWSPENIEKALGQNFLRAWRELRGS